MSNHPFTYCLNTSTIRSQQLDILAEIDIVAEAGYDAIEPWVRELDAYVANGGDLEDLGARIRDKGLSVPNLIGFFAWGHPDAAERKKALEEARHNLAMADAIGCRALAAPPVGLTEMTDVTCLDLAERYAELYAMSCEFVARPILEFWGFSKTLNRLGQAMCVAAECGVPYAAILADIFHMYKGTGHFSGLSLTGAATIGLLHMNDYPADPPRAEIKDSARVYPGDGIAPVEDILRTLHRNGYLGTLSLELFNETYWKQDALEVAKTGLKKMKALAVRALA